MGRREVVPSDRAIWQSDTAKTYQCPVCLRPVFTQYEGNEIPVITCGGVGQPHVVEWEETAGGVGWQANETGP